MLVLALLPESTEAILFEVSAVFGFVVHIHFGIESEFKFAVSKIALRSKFTESVKQKILAHLSLVLFVVTSLLVFALDLRLTCVIIILAQKRRVVISASRVGSIGS